jgi:hypothetical protein
MGKTEDKNKELVAEDHAELEFNNFVEAMDLDLDIDDMDDDDLTAFTKQKKRIIKAIKKGHLVFNEDGEPVYTPYRPKTKHKDPITFHERTGASIMAMDRKKRGQDGAKLYAVLADMCKVPANTFASMAGEDIKICEALFSLLMD